MTLARSLEGKDRELRHPLVMSPEVRTSQRCEHPQFFFTYSVRECWDNDCMWVVIHRIEGQFPNVVEKKDWLGSVRSVGYINWNWSFSNSGKLLASNEEISFAKPLTIFQRLERGQLQSNENHARIVLDIDTHLTYFATNSFADSPTSST